MEMRVNAVKAVVELFENANLKHSSIDKDPITGEVKVKLIFEEKGN